jgi:exodeoxyribonuclease VII large subunit
LDRIYTCVTLFDVVVIIRGGGSTSELSSFDSYPLAANCAQFPLPVITGVGHERDDTVVDLVAHTRLKTPTAVAVFLIDCMKREAERVGEMEYRFCDKVSSHLKQEKNALQFLITKFPATLTGHIERHRTQLHAMTAFLSALPQWIRHRTEIMNTYFPRVRRALSALIIKRKAVIDEAPVNLKRAWETVREGHQKTIELKEQYTKMVAPEYVLKRGYTITMKEGKIVKQAADLFPEDEITVRFSDGERKGKVIF